MVIMAVGGALCVTTRVVLAIIVPSEAVIVAVPCPAPVAKPVVLIVATVVGLELHVTLLVRFCVLPSL